MVTEGRRKWLLEKIFAKKSKEISLISEEVTPKITLPEYDRLLDHELYRKIKELSPTYSTYEMAEMLGEPVERIALLRNNLHSAALTYPKTQSEEEEKEVELFSLEDFEVFTWFLFNTDRLPTEQFRLRHGTTVTDPAKFYASIELSILAGPEGPRSRYGALLDDVKTLKELYETTR